MHHTLTKTNSPEELLLWMNTNIKYVGSNKGKVYTPEEVIQYKKAHCWESTELAYKELTTLGYKCLIVYLETPNCTVTHSTLIYSKNNNWKWFEWTWYKHSQDNISFNNSLGLINYIKNIFIYENKQISDLIYCKSIIEKNMTELEYISKLRELGTSIKL